MRPLVRVPGRKKGSRVAYPILSKPRSPLMATYWSSPEKNPPRPDGFGGERRTAAKVASGPGKVPVWFRSEGTTRNWKAATRTSR